MVDYHHVSYSCLVLDSRFIVRKSLTLDLDTSLIVCLFVCCRQRLFFTFFQYSSVVRNGISVSWIIHLLS